MRDCDNWRAIIAECERFIGKDYVDAQDRRLTFLGVLHGDDDYYYVMRFCGTGRIVLLSCVGNLNEHGYELLEPG